MGSTLDRSPLARALVVAALLVFFAGCGSDPGLTLVVRDADNRPMAGVNVVDAAADARLGTTDVEGRVVLRPSRRKGELIRVRCRPPEEMAARWAFDDPITLSESDFKNATKIVRAFAREEEMETEPSSVSLRIETQPPGAELWVEGRPAGRSPTTIPGLHAGMIEVRLRLSGYEEVTKQLILVEGMRLWTCDLDPVDAPPPIERPRNTRTLSTEVPTPITSGRSEEAEPPQIASEPEADNRVAPAVRTGAQEARALDEAAIRTLLDQYAAALRSLDLDSYARLFTTLPEDRRSRLKRSFSDLKSQQVTLSGIQITPTGDHATVSFRELVVATPKAGSSFPPNERRVEMTLEQSGTGVWHIALLKYPGGS